MCERIVNRALSDKAEYCALLYCAEQGGSWLKVSLVFVAKEAYLPHSYKL